MLSTTSEKMIPLSEPFINGNEWKYVKECLDSGWVSSAGTYVNKFEERVRAYVGAKHAVAVTNGTAALHLSLLALGVGKEDEVIVPALTFISPVNAVKYCGASPVFMDCDPKTLCLDVKKVSDFLVSKCERKEGGFTYNKKTGKRIKAIIPVHVFGHPVDLDRLKGICAEHRIIVIEDAAESLGSEYKGRKTGSIGDVGCLSFNGNKIITTGGGGMVVTDNEEIARKARHLSTQANIDPLRYEHDGIGYNYRLSNVQAAIGVAQMERINEYVDIKRRNALKYKELFADCSEAEFLWEMDGVKSNFWFYTVKVPTQHKEPLMNYLLEHNIQVRSVWKLINSLPMHEEYESYRVESAKDAYASSINLPCSVNLKQEDLEYVVETVKEYFKTN